MTFRLNRFNPYLRTAPVSGAATNDSPPASAQFERSQQAQPKPDDPAATLDYLPLLPPRRARSVSAVAFFSCLLLLALVCGCQTEKRRKAHAVTTLRVHLECSAYDTDRNQSIFIPREHPTKLWIEKEAILTEANVAGAKVLSEMDAFVINLQLDHRGRLVLEQYTAGNRGHRLAVFCEFGLNLSTNRWLAAPLITRVINDGSLTFTPDASRAEADQIVLGLNNVAKKVDAMDR